MLIAKFKSAIRVFLSPISLTRFFSTSYSFVNSNPSIYPSLVESIADVTSNANSNDIIASSFKDWFKSANNETVLDRIFEILSYQELSKLSEEEAEAALCSLRLPLCEEFVLKVLNYPIMLSPNRKSVLPRLKFFDWAGRQKGYCHTRATFHAIFKILSKAKQMTVILDWLEKFPYQRDMYILQFYNTLVMGYAVSGKIDLALQMFGRMRFKGLDLDSFGYHVLLNSLVEENCYDMVEVILKQIEMRGHSSFITSSIKMNYLCKQRKLDEAVAFLQELRCSGKNRISAITVSILVDALCKQKRFNEAKCLVEELGHSGEVPLSQAYSFWISDLVKARMFDGAMNFLQDKKSEGFVPEAFCYNKLIYGLLRENRLEEVYDLLVEMRKGRVSPDKLTMNAALCFFCKAGMVDVALELYNSRLEFGLSPNSLAYNYLINALCGDGSADKACLVLEDSVEHGYFPGQKTFQILADTLCREGKLDKVSKLIDTAMKKNVVPSNAICVKYITALCEAGRAEEGYLLPSKLNLAGNILNKHTYANLIRGLSKSKRGEMAARLLLEMQEKGHFPTRNVYRSVIRCLCGTGNTELVLKLLEIQLSRDSRHKPNCHIFNSYIDGAGHSGEPELARELFHRMLISGNEPNMETNLLMLQSYLKSKRVAVALNFFQEMCKTRKPSNKVYNTLIIGLCRAGNLEVVLENWKDAREKGFAPSLQCYEELVHALCLAQNYGMVVQVLNDFEGTGRYFSSFICNVLLLHTLKTKELNRVWVNLRDVSGEPFRFGTLMLGELVAAFSGGIRVKHHLKDLDELVKKFFIANTFTYNMLLRGLCREGRMDLACDLFNKLCKKGYQPNRYTYDIIVHGFCKLGRKRDANIWIEEMQQDGFYPTDYTIAVYDNMEKWG